ncbi:uncharacterized protein L3040_006649 [Drepanopeziza brunnea f. sp. 'multigermtubi']|uniref:Uncharacterized protein n=1 Tax=Marssonina brunnea f. sp. multigermtubi (strain MB_m1) TaxID=1072389 RepID=K1X9Z0_MARBU|nr:uncharacterized protein MBM_04394 [Drepanopeziza brunnea f. sp. 'multigermtubi' MB_m1]EKD17533.1 hypothetical protein MBM_04394 [Drepanopeziza brunnea f. sp. 'multigermtubi' MB_m1]KAJ5038976.1 hypothetical protein L3040_006649 [Drepanopeziza brunnea f. sp. 'multigermtubi']
MASSSFTSKDRERKKPKSPFPSRLPSSARDADNQSASFSSSFHTKPSSSKAPASIMPPSRAFRDDPVPAAAKPKPPKTIDEDDDEDVPEPDWSTFTDTTPRVSQETPYEEVRIAPPGAKSVLPTTENAEVAAARQLPIARTIAPKEHTAPERRAAQMVATMAHCPANRGWHRVSRDGGYRCASGAPFVTHRLLAEGRAGLYLYSFRCEDESAAAGTMARGLVDPDPDSGLGTNMNLDEDMGSRDRHRHRHRRRRRPRLPLDTGDYALTGPDDSAFATLHGPYYPDPRHSTPGKYVYGGPLPKRSPDVPDGWVRHAHADQSGQHQFFYVQADGELWFPDRLILRVISSRRFWFQIYGTLEGYRDWQHYFV